MRQSTRALILTLMGVCFGLTIHAAESGTTKAVGRTPQRIDLGILRPDAVAEASVIVEFPIVIDPANLTLTAPAFVRVVTNQVEIQDPGTEKATTVCDLLLNFDTHAPGTNRGTLRLEAGLLVGEVPVAAVIAPREPGLTRLLVLDPPWWGNAFEDDVVLGPWHALVRSNRLDPDYRLKRHADPKRPLPELFGHDLVLIGGESLLSLDESERIKLRTFADAGGRLLVFADHFFAGTIPAANRLIAPYGLMLTNHEPPSVPGFVESSARDLGQNVGLRVKPHEGRTHKMGSDAIYDDALTAGVSKVHEHRPTPIFSFNPTTRPLVKLAAQTNGFLAIVAPVGKGEIVVVGLSLWWAWPAEELAAGTDTARFLGNLVRRKQP
jgi:hypothetical protein